MRARAPTDVVLGTRCRPAADAPRSSMLRGEWSEAAQDPLESVRGGGRQ